MIEKNTLGNVVDFIERLEFFNKNQVLVGVPGKTNDSNGDVNNATLAALHEMGGTNLPERSFIRSTIRENGARYAKTEAEQIAQSIAGGTEPSIVLERLGTMVSNDIKVKIVNGPFKDLEDITAKRKGSDKPLIDTGAMRQSISYEVRKK